MFSKSTTRSLVAGNNPTIKGRQQVAEQPSVNGGVISLHLVSEII